MLGPRIVKTSACSHCGQCITYELYNNGRVVAYIDGVEMDPTDDVCQAIYDDIMHEREKQSFRYVAAA